MAESELPPDSQEEVEEQQQVEEPSRSDGSAGEPEQPAAKPKVDWRIVAIVCVAVLFLIAIYINRTKSRDSMEGDPSGQVEESRPPAAEAPQPPRVPLSPEQRYRRLVLEHELRAKTMVFKTKDRTHILSRPPESRPAPAGEVPESSVARAFDVTRRLPGIEPWWFYRRQNYMGQRGLLFMDEYGRLGGKDGLEIIVKPASEVVRIELAAPEHVIGVKVGDEARAYPIRFLNYHDVVNDTLSEKPIAVAWSALAEAASAMERTLADGTTLSFGSAGLVYQGVIVLYDLETESLWAPLTRQCVAGESVGKSLTPIQATVTTWETWKKMQPNTTAAFPQKPSFYGYDGNPALPSPEYLKDGVYLFPVYGLEEVGKPMPMKARVFGVIGPDGKTARAYELGLLLETKGTFEDQLGGRKVVLQYDPDASVLTAKDADGKPLRCEGMFWFAWRGAHPKTEVWKEKELIGKSSPAPEGPEAVSGATKTTASPPE